MLRLHRPRYHSRASIGSELSWLEAITDETDIPVPRPIPGADGEIVQEVAPERFAALFAFERGAEPQPDADLVPLFATLGRYAALLHNHVIGWAQPEGSCARSGMLSASSSRPGLWGDWRKAPHVEGETLEVLAALDEALRGRSCRLWHRYRPLRADPCRYAARQPAGRWRANRAARFRRLRLRLVPLRPCGQSLVHRDLGAGAGADPRLARRPTWKSGR